MARFSGKCYSVLQEEMPVYVKSLAHSTDIIILIISLCLPHFVLEMLTKKKRSQENPAVTTPVQSKEAPR